MTAPLALRMFRRAAALSAVLFVLPAMAASTIYSISGFTLTQGSIGPASGSFVYDPTAGFSNFFVTWYGATLDLTSAANHPTLYTTGPGYSVGVHADSFAVMTHALPPPRLSYQWDAYVSDAYNVTYFGFGSRASLPGGGETFVYLTINVPPIGADTGGVQAGAFNVQAVSTMALAQGFNLSGNDIASTLDVVAMFGALDQPVPGVSSNIESVWTWHAIPPGTLGTPGRWRFHTPQFTQAQSASHAAANGWEVLTTVAPGDGYWVNANTPISIQHPTGTPYTPDAAQFALLPQGFSLLAIGQTMTVQEFANSLGVPAEPGSPVAESFNALWAWDAPRANWYFYSPSLDQSGAPFGNCSFAAANGYLDFGGGSCAPAPPPAPPLSLQPGMGFWVEKF